MTRSGLSAAILIGGASRRMGMPKALLRLEPDGPTLLERVACRLGSVTTEVMLVGRAAWPVPESLARLPRCDDRGDGPADGIVAALAASAAPLCIVVACDMPFLHPPLLERMVMTARRAGRGVVVADDHGMHPLHAVYRRDDLPVLAAAIEEGERSLGALVARAGMIEMALGAPDASDADRASVLNLNTPADLEAARARLRR